MMMMRRNSSNQCPNISENSTLTINIESRSNSSMSTGVSGTISRASSHMSHASRMSSVPSPLSSVNARELESPTRLQSLEQVEVYIKPEGGQSNLSKAGPANSSAAASLKGANRPQDTSSRRWCTSLMALLLLVCMCLLAAAAWILLIPKGAGTVPPPDKIEASLGGAYVSENVRPIQEDIDPALVDNAAAFDADASLLHHE